MAIFHNLMSLCVMMLYLFWIFAELAVSWTQMIIFILPSRGDYYVSNNTNFKCFYCVRFKTPHFIYLIYILNLVLSEPWKKSQFCSSYIIIHTLEKILIRNECWFTVSLIVSQTCIGSRIGSHKIIIIIMREG